MLRLTLYNTDTQFRQSQRWLIYIRLPCILIFSSHRNYITEEAHFIKGTIQISPFARQCYTLPFLYIHREVSWAVQSGPLSSESTPSDAAVSILADAHSVPHPARIWCEKEFLHKYWCQIDQKQCSHNENHVQTMEFTCCLNMVFTWKSSREAEVCLHDIMLQNYCSPE